MRLPRQSANCFVRATRFVGNVVRRLCGRRYYRQKRTGSVWVSRRSRLHVDVRGIQAGGYDISSCRSGDPVELVAEPMNLYDSHAIKVVSESGEKLGYVPADYAAAMEPSDWSAVIAAVSRFRAGPSLLLTLTRRNLPLPPSS